MEIVKIIVGVALFLVFALAVEVFRLHTGIPISVGDIIILPLCVFLLYVGVEVLSFRKKGKSNVRSEPVSNKRLFWGIVLSAIFLPVGVWIAIVGMKSPLKFFDSARGAAHGYSYYVLGMVMSMYCAYFLFRSIKLLIAQRQQ